MHAGIHISTYPCIFVFLYPCIFVGTYIPMTYVSLIHVYTYVYMQVCIDVCMYKLNMKSTHIDVISNGMEYN